MSTFHLTKLVALPDGESAFVEAEVATPGSSRVGNMSAMQPAAGMVFINTVAGYDFDFHTAPVPHYAVILSGRHEFTCSKGNEARVFGPGDVLWVTDTTGKGHRTRDAGKEGGRWAWVPCVPVGEVKPQLSGHSSESL
ncbi:hypothetical protein DFJ74DRAFT_691146 [Hyaloraphidium curvatum]|nr:hypothetical protein DFJ74DRAFT_691146 [Hyaloraphidium curvatum]